MSYLAIFWECLQTFHSQCPRIQSLRLIILYAWRKIKQNQKQFSPSLCSLDLSWEARPPITPCQFSLPVSSEP